MKIIVLLLAFLILTTDVFSQSTTPSIRKNTVYIEAGGNGGYGSLNYERLLPFKNNFHITGRIGISTIKIIDFNQSFNPDILVPIGVNAFYGLNHKIQLGVGQVFANTVYSSLEGQTLRQVNLHTYFTIGYRYQKEGARFLFGINYTPFLEYQKTFRHWGGITIGYSF